MLNAFPPYGAQGTQPGPSCSNRPNEKRPVGRVARQVRVSPTDEWTNNYKDTTLQELNIYSSDIDMELVVAQPTRSSHTNICSFSFNSFLVNKTMNNIAYLNKNI